METPDAVDLPNTVTTTDLPSTIALLRRLSSLASSTLSSFPVPNSPITPLYKTPLLPSLSPPTSPLPLPSPSSDLCFSLDPPSHPFYQNCPAVVRFPRPADPPNSFLLPSTLASLCSNFTSPPPPALTLNPPINVLPSDLHAARSEIAAWVEPPISYSYNVLRLASCLDLSAEAKLRDRIIRNSPRHEGIIVSSALADRVLLLLKLCLKATWREATESLRPVFDGGVTSCVENLAFDCPRLCGSVTWLGTQLGILYGEVEGGRFALELIGEGIVLAGFAGLLFEEEEVAREMPPAGFFSEGIFVSQVASAISGLHEWVSMERRVGGSRPGSVSLPSEILREHLYTSEKANEERGRRIDYKPLLEHDGLIWQHSHIENKGMPKSRMEIMAEERDYKRRRMSYRGKKVKRTPIQVLHDIIDEHMEEIKRAGGIGCHVKGTTGSAMQHFTPEFENVEKQKARITVSKMHGCDVNLYSKQTFGEDNNSRLASDGHSSYLTVSSGDADGLHSKPCHGYDKRQRNMGRRDAYRDSNSSLTCQSTQSSRTLEERYSRRDRHSSISHRSEDDRSRSSCSKYSTSREHGSRPDDYTSRKRKCHKYYDTDSLSCSSFDDRYDPHSSYFSSSRSFKDRYDPSDSSDIYEGDHSYSRSKCGKSDHSMDDASGGSS